jgi:hypothetical protein
MKFSLAPFGRLQCTKGYHVSATDIFVLGNGNSTLPTTVNLCVCNNRIILGKHLKYETQKPNTLKYEIDELSIGIMDHR